VQSIRRGSRLALVWTCQIVPRPRSWLRRLFQVQRPRPERSTSSRRSARAVGPHGNRGRRALRGRVALVPRTPPRSSLASIALIAARPRTSPSSASEIRLPARPSARRLAVLARARDWSRPCRARMRRTDLPLVGRSSRSRAADPSRRGPSLIPGGLAKRTRSHGALFRHDGRSPPSRAGRRARGELEALGAVPLGAPVGHGARGLLEGRLGLGLPAARARAQPRVPLGRGRLARLHGSPVPACASRSRCGTAATAC
jgi:hypothetical protein